MKQERVKISTCYCRDIFPPHTSCTVAIPLFLVSLFLFLKSLCVYAYVDIEYSVYFIAPSQCVKVIVITLYFTAFFECALCHSTMTVEIDRGRIAEPIVCANCSAKYTMTLIHNRSSFTDKQMVKLQESPGMYHVCCVCVC